MNWVEEQIKERRTADQQALEDSFRKIASVVLGERTAQRLNDERIFTRHAIDEILKYYHFKSDHVTDQDISFDRQLDLSLGRYGIMRRGIELTEGWYRDSFGPVLAFLKEGNTPVAIFQDFFNRYYYNDPVTGRHVKINRKNADLFDREALCFYRPLPMRKIGIPDLLLYMKQCINIYDVALIALLTLAATLVGILIPQITAALTGPVLNSGRVSALIGTAVFILCVSISSQIISAIGEMMNNRLMMKTSLGVEASMMMRLLSLPVSFFRQYSPGEMRVRADSVGQLTQLLLTMVTSAGLSSLSSLLYITQIFRFSAALVIPSVIIVLVTVLFSVVTTFVQMGISRKQMDHAARESGIVFSTINGVQKIKLAGAEKRAYARWMELYAEGAAYTYDPPAFLKYNSIIAGSITSFSNIILYYLAVVNGVDQASYFAFTSAYGMLMGAFGSLASIAMDVASIRPILEMAEPFLKAVPENAECREMVTHISGGVELDHVSFRYNTEQPYVLDDLSLKISPGDYIAIVGSTGCGKSTLIRLLLGFETPEKGAVYYDGKDINTLDAASLRQNIGTVTQDGDLFQGDIYSNIVISAPGLSVDEAWKAAEIAQIADDIRAMPMGMNTLISEGQGGISGGQKQRLMIARAIAPLPKMLILDEATSALDNVTQKQVSLALDSMGCTRVVVAHRLSTIRNCDRIVVMDQGRIVEDGTYDQLIEKNGFFASLVERQRLDRAG